MDKSNFRFDLNAKRIRITDDRILSSVKEYAKSVNFRYFPTTEYDKWEEKIAHTGTIIERFGSWKKVLALLGIEGGRERKYTTEQLVDNLENIWKQLGYPPGKRQIGKLGLKISEHPYKIIWGSVCKACECLAAFHEGRLSREKLLKGTALVCARRTIPLNIRWAVLKRDKYRCVKCGKAPSVSHGVELEVDHIRPIAKGGVNDIENLQTLCKDCNQGKKDRE
jgi:hypothetical protein